MNDFLVTVLTLEHITAEKIRALIIRKKARDLYDLWVLLEKGIEIEKKLLDKKLGLYDRGFESTELEEAIKDVEGGWERDLRTLLPSIPEYESISSMVMEKLRYL
ncbi:MAG: nucleotidyl transferase AbiEii/AbiGii toxin family protein [Thermoplasmatota archaeon]